MGATTVLVEKIEPEFDQPQRNVRPGVLVWTIRVGLVMLLFGGWQIAAGSSQAIEIVISRPSAVGTTLAREFGSGGAWWGALAITLRESALGFVLGLASAVALLVLTAPLWWVARFIGPFVAAANALPIVIMAPLFIVWFGISLQSKVYFVAVAIFFILYYGLFTGIRSIDPGLVDNARVLGARRLQLVRQIYAPAALTWTIAGLRLSSAWSLLAAVVAEYLGSNAGIGYEIATAQQNLEVSVVIAGILAVATVAVILDRALIRLEQRFSRWRVF
ncbi:ABC transporter permease [Dactylosporangium sp. NPDC005572]|uniref:ABC transporter permease n=1 Tax=Dactylosporangium sp. NPDC005572 TaxID=3156889 RepID=UPI0033A1D117